METLPVSFYERDPAEVARGLLGKRLVLKTGDATLEGIIVETEAYYGSEDPASRAYHGKKNYNEAMWGEPGRVFIYNVHKHWMFNVVAHEPGGVGGVLIRAVEPVEGIEAMMKNRPVGKLRDLTSGPGKLTEAWGIDKGLLGADVTDEGSEVFIAEGGEEFDVGASRRIGVRRDLERDLRFYIEGNEFVSR